MNAASDLLDESGPEPDEDSASGLVESRAHDITAAETPGPGLLSVSVSVSISTD